MTALLIVLLLTLALALVGFLPPHVAGAWRRWRRNRE